MIHAVAQRGVEVLDVVGLGLDRRVDGVMSQVNKERLVARVIDYLHCFIREPVGEILAGLPKFQMWNVTKLRPVKSAAAVGPEESLRCAPISAADIYVKAVSLRVMLPIAEVPLTDEGSEITSRV